MSLHLPQMILSVASRSLYSSPIRQILEPRLRTAVRILIVYKLIYVAAVCCFTPSYLQEKPYSKPSWP
ncbi:hypothetical protein M501DRAFT_995108 [Patellaria atrata CBS 101060]|uniref:Uncharacterized protein n=1 Tax=Patellaria atrata CBS 101060 TaxID=1346257 RepID=A0A9P4S8A4_9PEZI|nr:hypothetical protein M501DRAFT_995108 [Patellaria atrata CBS 101060]